jgi:aryl-alcohol dehydrogenase-like predicted oxidoreductase
MTRPLGPFSVSAIGFGALRLTGPGVFGPPSDREEALAVLREAVERGVDHIDTAQFYGPDVVNGLIRETLYPYPEDLILVSKVGARRDRHGRVLAAQGASATPPRNRGEPQNTRYQGDSCRQSPADRRVRAGRLLRRSTGRHDRCT